MTEHGLGRHKPVRDDRDRLLRDRVGLYRGTTVRRQWSMVGADFRIDQGNEGTCVGHGCTNVLLAGPVTHSTFPAFDSIYDAHLFARQLYYEASGDSTYQEGTYTRLALSVLKNRGMISYYRVASVDEIISTLLNIGPITFGSDWYNSMFRTQSLYDNAYLNVDTGSGLAGGHLYCLTAVNLAPTEGPPYVRMENSWGPDWAKNGTARITIDDLHVLYDGDCYFLTEATF
jgi:Papain family cysteine protease